jgi:hypothetical protein
MSEYRPGWYQPNDFVIDCIFILLSDLCVFAVHLAALRPAEQRQLATTREPLHRSPQDRSHNRCRNIDPDRVSRFEWSPVIWKKTRI